MRCGHTRAIGARPAQRLLGYGRSGAPAWGHPPWRHQGPAQGLRIGARRDADPSARHAHSTALAFLLTFASERRRKAMPILRAGRGCHMTSRHGLPPCGSPDAHIARPWGTSATRSRVSSLGCTVSSDCSSATDDRRRSRAVVRTHLPLRPFSHTACVGVRPVLRPSQATACPTGR